MFFLVIASQAILYTTKKLENSFTIYKEKAVYGEVAVLNITKDVNYISRCTRDIMLGNDYDKNIEKIEKRIENINKNFEKLQLSFLGTENEKSKLELFEKTKQTTLGFVNDAYDKVKTLKRCLR